MLNLVTSRMLVWCCKEERNKKQKYSHPSPSYNPKKVIDMPQNGKVDKW